MRRTGWIVLIALTLAARSTRGAEFFVAVDGDNSAPGSSAQPFATLTRARDAVRELPADAVGDIVINIRAGDYRFEEPLLLTEADSGRNGFQVIYRACGGIGSARFLGSRPLVGWTRHEETAWKINIGKDTVFHTLYEGGKRCRKARFPNYEHDPELPCAAGPYLVSATGSPELEKGIQESWLTWRINDAIPLTTAGPQTKINVFPWGKCDWHRWICSVTDINAEERKITFANQNDRTRIGNRARYFLEDNIAFLDAPGEFSLDEAEGVLYYIPMGQGHPDELNITAPLVKDLVRIHGSDRQHQAHHIRFEGLSFTETDGISPTRFWWQFQWGRTGHAMVWMRNTDHIEVRNCHLKNSGRNGIMMVGENTENLVTGCWIEQMGVNGIALSNRFKSDSGPGATDDRLENNILTNSKIHDVGQLSIYNSCVALMNGSNNDISYSEFFNSPRYATTMRGNTDGQKYETPGWHRGIPPARGNRFHHLRVHHCGQDSGDMGTLHTASVNIPGGDCINTFEQITITDTRALPSMKDIAPDGIFLDWPKRSMHQEFRNIHVIRYQGLPFRTNGPDNKTSSVLDNVSWEANFDRTRMVYGEIGLRPDFPAEFGGAPRRATKLPVPTPAANAASYRQINLSWAPVKSAGIQGRPVYLIYRNNLLLQDTRTTSLTDTAVTEQTTYRYHLTVRAGDFGPESAPSEICEVRTPADLTPPEILAVIPSGDLKRLIVRLSEPVNPESITDTARFQISPDATVTAATPGTHADTVVLRVKDLIRENTYQLLVSGITDTATARNVVKPRTRCAFKTDFLIAHCTASQAEAGGAWRLHGKAEWTPDRSGLLLNGRDAYAEGTAELNLGNADFALAVWIWKIRAGSAIIAAKGNGFGAANEWSLGWEEPAKADNVAFRCNNRYYTTAVGSIPLDAWVHIAFVKQGNVGTSYINGVPSGEPHELTDMGDLTNASPLLIGRRSYEPSPAWFAGKIADLRIYTRALHEKEVESLATTQPDQETER